MNVIDKYFKVFCFLIIILFQSNVIHGQSLEDLIVSPEFTISNDVVPANSDTEKPGKPTIAFDGTNYLVVSCRETDPFPGIFGVLVSRGGAIVKSIFQIANTNLIYGCQFPSVSATFDGANYFVVFSRVTSSGSSATFGTRVSPSGIVLNELDGFFISSGANPTVAFDGNNFLVVTVKFDNGTLHDLYGAKVNTDGLVLNEFSIFVAPNSQYSPTIAFDGKNYFLIWTESINNYPLPSDDNIIGTRVTPAGNILDPEGIPISTATGAQTLPSIIYDGNNYFAVWQDTRLNPIIFPPASNIYGARITQNGELLDGPSDTGGIAINTAPHPKRNPVISFDSANNYYLVAWESSFFYNPPIGIFSARVSSDGHLIDGPPDSDGILINQPSCSSCRSVHPAMLYNGETIVLAWVNNEEVTGNFKDIEAVLINNISSDLLFLASNYFPLSEGLVWSYLIDDSTPNTILVSNKSVYINGIKTKVLEDPLDGGRKYYSNDDKGIRIHRSFYSKINVPNFGIGNLTMTFKPPINVINPVTHIGEKVKSNGIVRTKLLGVGSANFPYSSTFTMEAVDSVKVPSGTYDVVRVQGEIKIQDLTPVFFTFNLAKNIGVVKLTSSELGFSKTAELMDSNAWINDLAIYNISAPRVITLSKNKPFVTHNIKIVIQNRSPYSKTIKDMSMLENLVHLKIASLGSCPDLIPVLLSKRPQQAFPFTLKSKKKMNIYYRVAFNCANDPLKNTSVDSGHEDFSLMAIVDHTALNEEHDIHPDDDVCPHSVFPPYEIDDYPDRKIKDKGCGGRKSDRTFGADILVDILKK